MNKKKKNNNIVFVAILALAVVGFFAVYFFSSDIDDLIPGIPGAGESEDGMMKVHMYDKDGNEIIYNTMSIVDGVEGVYYLSFDITMDNDGEVDFTSCNITDATPGINDGPYYFSLPMDEDSGAVAEGSGYTWIGTQFETASFDDDLGRPTTFTATVTCDYEYAGSTETISETGTLNVLIEPDPVAGMSVTVDY